MAGPPQQTPILWLAVGFEGALLALALALGWLLEQPPLEHYGFNVIDALTGSAAVLPLLGLYLAAMRWPLGPLRGIKQILEEFVRPLFASASVLDLAVVSLIAG